MGVKTNKIMVITITDSRGYPNQFWEKPLKENCKELIWIDLQEIFFNNQQNKVKDVLLSIVLKEKPDYLFMFDALFYDLDIPYFLSKITKFSPKTKKVLFSGDDDLRFDFTRYIALFFDYIFIAHRDFLPSYKKDGFRNISYLAQTKKINVPINKNKTYDVSFIGTPKADRKEIIDYLCKNNIHIALFGYNWDRYPELKGIWGGVLSSEKQLEVINNTKINLDFSKNQFGVPHLNDRFFTLGMCKAFSLVQDGPLKELFKEGKEIIFFNSKEDLKNKIEYYLKDEREREKISENAYKKVISKFDLDRNINIFLSKHLHTSSLEQHYFPKSSIINLNEDLMKLPKLEIMRKVESFNYISFSRGRITNLPFKNNLQIYSIEKTGKKISCSDYFLHSNLIGDYASFRYCQKGKINSDENVFLNFNQIILTRDFFVQNIDLIMKDYERDKISFVTQDNTAYVSIPLVKVDLKKELFKNKELSKEIGFFLFSFHRNLISRRKRPFSLMMYTFGLMLEIVSGKKFLFDQIIIKLKNNDIYNKIKESFYPKLPL